MTPLRVSTIIPTYNRSFSIQRAVSSALVASSAKDEIIVVDDGSTDNTEEVLMPFRDKIRYIRISRSGAGAARNRGVLEARNPLVAFLDSDDEWLLNKLNLQRAVMQKYPDALFSFSNFAVHDISGNVYNNFLQHWHNDLRPWDEILGPGVSLSSFATLPEGQKDFTVHLGDLYSLELRANYVTTITLIVRRDEAKDALWFAEDLPLYEDWECFGRLARAGKGAYLNCETAINHGHLYPRLTDGDVLTKATARIKILERVWGSDKNFLSSHNDIYQDIMMEQRLIRTKCFLRLGRMNSARKELRLIKNCPFYYRLLQVLPGVFVKQLLNTYSFVKRAFCKDFVEMLNEFRM